MAERLITKEFIEKAKAVHGDKYGYGKIEYKGSKIKIKIICFEHGVFEQTPNKHLKGQGCPKCGGRQKLNIQGFIEKAINKHGYKYDYLKVEYSNNYTKVKIICSKHGVFEQTPNKHLSGQGCPSCAIEITCKKLSSNKEDFIRKAIVIHCNKYDYSKVEYIVALSKVKIICKKHGIFCQQPSAHLSGQGCPICNESKGEKIISKYLTLKNIKYISQKRFKDCIYKKILPFDFYIPSQNLCIEYDGKQHYKAEERQFGSNMTLEEAKKELEFIRYKDKIKDEYCRFHNIKILRISYKNDINEILNSYFKYKLR